MSSQERPDPFVVELDAVGPETPATAPPVPDPDDAPGGAAMQAAASFAAARPGSALGRWFLRALLGFVGFWITLAAWDFVAGLFARNVWLGRAGLVLLAAVIVGAVLLALRELRALRRLARVDRMHQAAATARATADLPAARALLRQLDGFYRGRDALAPGRAALAAEAAEILDADALLDAAERRLLVPLDALARREVEGAARQVAAVTALVPLALADVAAALIANLRMIRRLAEIYGGRSGALGGWRLTRAVMTHLVATGAIAAGEDMIEPLVGGGLLARLSRRFGEGVVNGALTARVGVAAMEVCRPLPFGAGRRPSTSRLVKRALTGLFDRDGRPKAPAP
jgi:putative membrane protein